MCHSNKLKYDVDCLKLSINMKKIQLLNYNPVHTVYEKKVQGVVSNATIPPGEG
jgi:hypothetical protein